MNARNRRKQAKLLEFISGKLWASNDKANWKLIHRVKMHPRWDIIKIHGYTKAYRYWKFVQTYPRGWIMYDNVAKPIKREASNPVPICNSRFGGLGD